MSSKHINWLELEAVLRGIPVSGTRLQGLDKVRQLNSRSLLKQAGRDPITSALCLNLGNNDVVHGNQGNYKNSTHPRKEEFIADGLLPNRIRHTEWTLNPESLRSIFLLLGQPVIDLFATKLNKQLPVYDHDGNHKAASRDTVSRWITALIRWAYENSVEGDLKAYKIRAHDVRTLSASLAEIMEAASWSTASTFSSFYLKDVAKERGTFARVVLS
ncbi:hypothetical protein HOLleu_08092 [Holothuria leucospilota]|uniref:Uncharacterized protein n=1 Tax=Holothuria leucospilota TaxID=206669 RepID=A0A9Q1HG28_HOLLE|nr:hypothetical protein HOLleu_08092 [Holothuria leucospilota]